MNDRQLRARGAQALCALLVVTLGLAAFVMISSANEVDRIRGDFCTWAQVHYREALTSPASPARTADAQADEQLAKNLGCAP